MAPLSRMATPLAEAVETVGDFLHDRVAAMLKRVCAAAILEIVAAQRVISLFS